MREIGKKISLLIGELAYVAGGVLITLGFAALVLSLARPIRSEYYAYIGAGAVLLGFLVWIALMRTIFQKRDSARFISSSVAVLAASLAFHVIVPMTIERSITVFLLQEMARAPDHAYTPAELETRFRDGYFYGRDMLGKRIRENTLSGNMQMVDDRVRLTRSGLMTVTFLNALGRIFSVPSLPAK